MKYIKITDDIAHIKSSDGTPVLFDLQSGLDLIGTAWQNGDCTRIVIDKEDIADSFLDLKTRIAGEVFQKFVNYNFRIAIVGDYSSYTSKSLQDFIFESNKGKIINFTKTLEDAIAVLSK